MITYEWGYEIEDQNGDIIDNHFEDNLNDLKGESGNLVLVRNEGNEIDGVTDRYWAYVKANKLPDFFTDSMGSSVNIKVPQKFRKQLNNFLLLITL